MELRKIGLIANLLEHHDLFQSIQGMDFGINLLSGEKIEIAIFNSSVTATQLRELKRIFGPFAYRDDGDTKDAIGKAKCELSDGTRFDVALLVYDQLQCKPLEYGNEGPSAEQMENVRQQIIDGSVKVTECLQADNLVEASPGAP